jgi:hypothetical protein
MILRIKFEIFGSRGKLFKRISKELRKSGNQEIRKYGNLSKEKTTD